MELMVSKESRIMNMVNALAIDKRNYDHLSDEDVVARILNSDKQMYGVIFHRYNQRLYRIIYSILNEAEASKEALQFTHMKAYEKLGQFEGRSGFGTWLTRIAINEAIRKTNLKKRYVFRDTFNSETSNEMEYFYRSGNDSNPEFKTIQMEIRRMLKNAIESLPEKYRSVFMLREVDGLNVEETARYLEISEVNVKVRLCRAKSLLREILHKQKMDTEIMPLSYCA